ncbi:c-type cytochrome [Skermanella rosea]|uniref:c-type cytochrome n=1 Tax=Skermanella rosea TaxID=1817965 RepID=UPI0019340E3B|nr:c-type cytochrome [Skermanella rosea]UEM02574.1 c-type cytochrome [Skermanella rosea]
MIRAAVLSGVLCLAAASPAAAEPPGASSCSGCHALRGEAAPGIPPILSKSADEIAAAMLAYRAGEGGPTVMDRISKGFTEEEIRAIAAWIASRR